jgi:hypothetical protein
MSALRIQEGQKTVRVIKYAKIILVSGFSGTYQRGYLVKLIAQERSSLSANVPNQSLEKLINCIGAINDLVEKSVYTLFKAVLFKLL